MVIRSSPNYLESIILWWERLFTNGNIQDDCHLSRSGLPSKFTPRSDRAMLRETAKKHKSYISDSTCLSKDPSIHSLYLLYLTQGSEGARASPRYHWARGDGTPCTGRQSITGPHRDKQGKNHPHSHSLQGSFVESAVNLSCMFLSSRRKLEYPERSHAYTGRTCKLHTERPELGFEPGTLLLWGDGANLQ